MPLGTRFGEKNNSPGGDLSVGLLFMQRMPKDRMLFYLETSISLRYLRLRSMFRMPLFPLTLYIVLLPNSYYLQSKDRAITIIFLA
jgi:hypothetical protein